jgi:hypothetical protein
LVETSKHPWAAQRNDRVPASIIDVQGGLRHFHLIRQAPIVSSWSVGFKGDLGKVCMISRGVADLMGVGFVKDAHVKRDEHPIAGR